MNDDYDFPLEQRILARRSGIPVHQVATLASMGQTHSLFDNRGRTTPKKARAILDGWKALFEAEEAQERRATEAAARRPASTAAKAITVPARQAHLRAHGPQDVWAGHHRKPLTRSQHQRAGTASDNHTDNVHTHAPKETSNSRVTFGFFSLPSPRRLNPSRIYPCELKRFGISTKGGH